MIKPLTFPDSFDTERHALAIEFEALEVILDKLPEDVLAMMDYSKAMHYTLPDTDSISIISGFPTFKEGVFELLDRRSGSIYRLTAEQINKYLIDNPI